MSQLELKQLHKRFAQNTAVEPTDLTFKSGELTALLGPSGCGKTTLLRMIAGLETPSSGGVFLEGDDITALPAHKRKFGMVFQSFALFPHLSVLENISYSLKIARTPKQVRTEKAQHLLDLVQLPDYGNRRIGELSGGQRQRVAIARALAQEPTVFLLDEPMSALDAKLREEMQKELRMLQQRLGITTIVVTHDQKEAMTMADHIVVMTQGKAEQTGSPDTIYNEPKSAFVASFIGKANLFEGTTHADGVDLGNVRLTTPKAQNFKKGSSVTVFVRPERTIVSELGEVGSNTVNAKISFVRNVGPSLEIHVESDIGQIIVDVPNRQQSKKLHVGKHVCVSLPKDTLQIFAKNQMVGAA